MCHEYRKPTQLSVLRLSDAYGILNFTQDGPLCKNGNARVNRFYRLVVAALINTKYM